MNSVYFDDRSNACNSIVHAVDEVHYGMLIVDLVLFKRVLGRFANII
jgi:predicted phosphatase